MSYVVEQVSVQATPDERLAGFGLEHPRAGEQSDLHVLWIAGWAAGRDRPVRAVEIVYHGRAIQVAPVRGRRPEVAAGDPLLDPEQNVAWGGLVGLLGLRADAEVELQVVFEDGARVPAARLRLRRTPLRSGFEPQLQPLVLSSLGRSGSTWMMKILASHPEIVVMRRFPYESSAAKYWMHAMKVLSDPANLAQSSHPDTFHSDRWWAGSNPYFDAPAIDDPERAAWLAGKHVERLARFFQETAEQWYQAVASSQDQRAPRYFAEKHLWPNFLPMLIRELYPGAREVFLVRDFRDVACSALVADERRGYAGFGRQPGSSEEEYVRDVIRRMATDMQRSWEARGRGAHLVRYEDLAHRPHETIGSLLAYLGVESSPETVARLEESAVHDVPDLPGTTFDPELVERHRSGRPPKSTIGRWQERDEPFREVLDDALGDALTAFGYDREGADAGGRASVKRAAEPAVDSNAEGAPADALRRQS